MKALCTCAAFAVATAFAHGNFAEAVNQDSMPSSVMRGDTLTGLTSLADGQHCTQEINEWRKTIDPDAAKYLPHTGTPSTDLGSFLTTANCANLKSGEYNHIVENSGKLFVITATKAGPTRAGSISCSEALEQWKQGYATFEGKYPSNYTEQTKPYNDPKAVGLVSLLSDTAQNIHCGTTTGCTEEMFMCYFTPAGIQASKPPVSKKMWHKYEESLEKKPTLKAHGTEHTECVDAVNEVRKVAGLELPEFTSLKAARSLRKREEEGTGTVYEEALYNLTCDNIVQSNIDPAVAKGYTLIYALGEQSDTAPTAADAVKFWKSGFSKLGTALPPTFKSKEESTRSTSSDSPITSDIYYTSNAVAGFVSIMTDKTREMFCYDATGCEKSAIICFLKDATLVNEQAPITDATWKKIWGLKNRADDAELVGDAIGFEKRADGENCLAEINEFRTQSSLGLEPFLVEESVTVGTKDAEQGEDAAELSTGLTCSSLKAGSMLVADSDAKRSLMYYYGEKATCSDALEAWKKGYEKFTDVTIPPQYNSSTSVYKTGEATNFISLVSEGKTTTATCYTVTGCAQQGLACVLKPSALKTGESPITEATWNKVTETMKNGASAASVYGTILGSILAAVGLFVLNF